MSTTDVPAPVPGGAGADAGTGTGTGTEDAAPAAASGGAPDRRRVQRRAELEEERDFLLRSLDDLRREHEAGDVDDADFAALEDDYTARAARVIRAIEALDARPARSGGARGPGGRGGRGGDSPGGQARRTRVTAAVMGVALLLFAVVAGVLVVTASDERQAGETATGGIRETTRTEIDRAVQMAAGGDYDAAIAAFDDVLADQPDNVEALTFKGWFQFLSGDQSGVVTLIDAVEVDPDYPATHAFLAVAFHRLGRPETALAELDRLDELDPPPDIANLVSGLRDEVEAAIAGSTDPTTDRTTDPTTGPSVGG